MALNRIQNYSKQNKSSQRIVKALEKNVKNLLLRTLISEIFEKLKNNSVSALK
jgi:hypothetical protein